MDDGAGEAGEAGAVQNRDFVASLARGLEVIKTFSRETPAMTLTEVARSAGMTRAAARRFLLTLQELGYVRSTGRSFELTPKILELGYSYLSSLDFPEIAAPFMEDVVREIQESCSASVLNQEDVVYVVRIPTSRIMSVSLNIGTKLPAFCTSMGRVLLAGLDDAEVKAFLSKAKLKPRTDRTVTDKSELKRIIAEVRRNGYALVDEELELGLRSIAVPIRNRRGALVAAINVGVHTSRATPQAMVERYLPVLQKAAERIQRLLP